MDLTLRYRWQSILTGLKSEGELNMTDDGKGCCDQKHFIIYTIRIENMTQKYLENSVIIFSKGPFLLAVVQRPATKSISVEQKSRSLSYWLLNHFVIHSGALFLDCFRTVTTWSIIQCSRL